MGFEFIDGVFTVSGFHAVSLGIIVLFLGRQINNKVNILQEFSIPEPVTGGICFSILFAIVYAVSSVEVAFELKARDFLLVYFFTTIGINANLKDLLKGGYLYYCCLGLLLAS